VTRSGALPSSSFDVARIPWWTAVAAAIALGALLLHLLVPRSYDHELVVTATAYNSLIHQTDGDPDVAAWGDRLEPGMRAIAVSRDLLKLGLKRGTRVRIDGLPGEFVVLDKMARRFKRRIDIYMGVNEDHALEWGRKNVRIFWSAQE